MRYLHNRDIDHAILKLNRHHLMINSTWTYREAVEEMSRWVDWDVIIDYAIYRRYGNHHALNVVALDPQGANARSRFENWWYNIYHLKEIPDLYALCKAAYYLGRNEEENEDSNSN